MTKRTLLIALALALAVSCACAQEEYLGVSQLTEYAYEGYGVCLPMPENERWSYDENSEPVNGLECLDATMVDTRYGDISVSIRLMDTGNPADDFADPDFLQKMLDFYGSYGVSGLATVTRGDPAVTFVTYSRDDGDETHKWLVYESVHGGISFRLRYPLFGDHPAKAAAIGEAMLDGFRWMQPEAQP